MKIQYIANIELIYEEEVKDIEDVDKESLINFDSELKEEIEDLFKDKPKVNIKSTTVFI